ncbi:MAG: HAD-IB family phosphatase [Thermoplasmataceae archaeon]
MHLKKYLALFDMDGVLTVTRSSWRIIHEELGTDNRVNFNLYLSGSISYKEFMIRDINQWLEAKPDLNKDYITYILNRIKLRIGFLDCMNELKSAGFIIGIISGGLYMLSEKLNNYFEFDEIQANKLMFDKNDVLLMDGEIQVVPSQKGRNVSDIMKKFAIKKENTISVGDSETDISMFKETQYSILMNPEPYFHNPIGKTIYTDDLRTISDDIMKTFNLK